MPLRVRALALAFVPGAALIAGCAGSYEPHASPRISVRNDGLGSVRLVKDGRSISVGAFGGGLEETVRGNPKAEEAARAHSRNLTVGFITGLVGTAAAGTGAGLMVYDSARGSTTLTPPGIGLLIGGAATAIVGSLFTVNAQTHFWNAINIYNDDLSSAAGAPHPYPLPTRPLGPGPSGDPGPSAPAGAPASPGAAPAAPGPQPPSVSPPSGLPPAPALPPGVLPSGTAPVPLGPRAQPPRDPWR